eukprot:TRINITY_DN59617_c0_g1_i1.p1 TRINITY_DN59617_c0_g1~~TRINITY_DN59617_c0_g1_i1.p1  ORF type:complete len:230 (+),score=26.38 TRINITY_DN59617_c0_g1_i1:1-690(+)
MQCCAMESAATEHSQFDTLTWLSSLPSGADFNAVATPSQPNETSGNAKNDDEWVVDIQQNILCSGGNGGPPPGFAPQPANISSWGLFLGGWAEADDIPRLQELGISAVVNLAPSHCRAADQTWGSRYPKTWDLLELDTDDTDECPLLSAFLSSVEEFITRQRMLGRSVLVHCFAGVNRSAAICAGYLIHSERLRLTEALRLLEERRGTVLQNTTFILQLVQLARREGLL